MATLLDEMVAQICALTVLGGYEMPHAQCREKVCERATPYGLLF